MLATTVDIIRSSLKADPTVSASERNQLLSLLRNGATGSKSVSTSLEPPRLIRRAEAARRLSCSLRMVDQLAAQGILKKQILPGRTRAAGFLESDVTALISGREKTTSDP